MNDGGMIILDHVAVEQHLNHRSCVSLMREAMIALTEGRTIQPLRAVIDLTAGNLFGIMPGAVKERGFGAKLISVFPNSHKSHQGAILLFEPHTGRPISLIEAGAVTAIRTASASAAATDCLAHADARRLAIFGTGEQAWHHACAIPLVRPIDHITIWGRNADRAAALASRIEESLSVQVQVAEDGSSAAADADIICTTTSASEPILFSHDVQDGTHINLVGSHGAGPVEIDSSLVARARYFADSRDGVLTQGSEYLRARDAGLIGEQHVLGEIGEVMNGGKRGRIRPGDVTIYKSLGHIVQDLTCAVHLVAKALEEGFGERVKFG